jgi:hypothetical protein
VSTLLLTISISLVFLAGIALVLWRMWMLGEISGSVPRTRRERFRLLWAIVGGLNFVAFLLHVMTDHGSAFPAGGRLVDGVYQVMEHGHYISFSPARYQFSFYHGLLFVIVSLLCVISVWRLRGAEELKGET